MALPTSERLDAIDLKILRALQKNARLTTKELAAEINLSTSPTFERWRRLEREGYIERYMAVVNPQKVSAGFIVLCNVRLRQHTHELISQFMDAVQSIDRVTDCWNTSGEFDFVIKVYNRDMAAYQDFMLNTLGNISCIGSLNSVFVIGEVKSSHQVPIYD